MTKTLFNHFATIFLLLLFTCKGLAPVLPAFSQLFATNRQEVLLNDRADNTEENKSEKEPGKNELFAPLSTDILPYRKYAAFCKSFTLYADQFQPEIFISIATPPPENAC